MFLIPLVFKDYFARAPVDFNEDLSPIPRIRAGTPVPMQNEGSSSRSQTQSAPQQTAPASPSPADQAANNRDRLASMLLALSRQVKGSSFSADSAEHFEHWFAQAEEMRDSISSNSFAAPNARLRRQ